MLRELKVENYAVIRQLDIEFHPGLNIITGETGAGKSILLGALSLLGGAKADTGMIRDGAAHCVIEGTFGIGEYKNPELEVLFEEYDLDYEDTITIRRMVSGNGKSRAFVDDIPVNVSALKAIMERLVDIHSQHQSLLLAGSGFQTRTVDAVAGNGPLFEQYAGHYKQLKALKTELTKAETAAETAIRERDYLQHQLDELLELNLKSGETAKLENEQNVLTHAEEIATALNECNGLMTDDEFGINAKIKGMAATLERLGTMYAPAEELGRRMESAYLELKDLASECESGRDSVEINPGRLEQVNERLDAIYGLCQKHTLQNGEELIAFREELDRKLQTLHEADEDIVRLRKEIEALQEKAESEAARLSTSRSKAAREIKKHVETTLKELGIQGAVFEVQVEPARELTPTGQDRLAMLFSGNPGTAPQPIENVASGGEMSRVMLALKGLAAQRMKLPTVIFDEIDQGVSGHVADKMGEIIARMGESMQVLNISHLPQVAAKGGHHYHVEKDTRNGTRIRELKPEERLEHIAMMLSGSQVTEAARKQAGELLKNQTKQ